MLPTLAVILWAYGMYALFSFMVQRKGGDRSQSRGSKLTGIALVGGVLGLGLILWCCYTSERQHQQLTLSGFLGTVYAEGWSGRVDNLEYPPIKAIHQELGVQPAYALLHPGTPFSQIEPEKKLVRPRPVRVTPKRHTPRVHKRSGSKPRISKTVTSSRKGKLAAKSRIRKKRRFFLLGGRQTNAG